MNRWRRWAAALVVATLAACGGGGSGSGDAPPDGGSGGDGTTLSVEARTESADRLAGRLEELIAAGNPQPFQALGDWARTQPEYLEAGAGPASIWVRFRDGRVLVYSDTWQSTGRAVPPDENGAPGIPATHRSPIRPLSAGLPEDDHAVLMAHNGTTDFPYARALMRRVGKMLEDRGWKVEPLMDLTVENLLRLPRMGIFYYTSHSALWGPEEKQEFSIMLSTEASIEGDEKYKAELDSGRMTYHRDRNAWNTYGAGKPPKYAITAQFIRTYLSFSKESLVVAVSCELGLPKAAAVRAAFLDRGASTLLAWEGWSNEYSHDAMEYMFDRLTGANAIDAPTPPGRPFAFEDVWAWMGTKTVDNYVLTLTRGVEGKPDAPIRVFGSGGFKRAVPILKEMEAMDDHLLLHGQFGDEPGTVTVGGVPASVVGWSPMIVEVRIPTGADDPAGSYGDVIVFEGERRSNRRVLSSWRGDVNYTYDLWPFDRGEGLLTTRVKADLHVRGDAHETRSQVDGAVRRGKGMFLLPNDNKATYAGEGTHVDGPRTQTWQGGGNLPFADGTRIPAFGGFGVIDSLAGEIKFLPTLSISPDMLTAVIDGVSKPIPMNFNSNALGISGPYGGDTQALGTAFRWDADRRVLGYDRRIKVSPSIGSSEWMRVQTPGMTVKPPFDDTVGR